MMSKDLKQHSASAQTTVPNILSYLIFKVLRRWGSGDGCRRRIPLGAPSHKPARRRSGCDGRL